MCLLVVSWRRHPRYPLVVAGNRDEFHNRPAAPLHWWDEPDGILAGRDLEAGGSWMGLHRSARFAVVTNYREPVIDSSGRSSRGELVVDYLIATVDDRRWADELDGRKHDYGGFNLVAGGAKRLHYLSNRGAHRFDLPAGIYGLSNHRLDTPWPKVVAARDRLREVVDRDELDSERLFGLLADRTPAPDHALPETGVPLEWERRLSPAFIVGESYGTRASTVLLVRADGSAEITERRFDPTGELVGEVGARIDVGSG